MTIAEYEKCGLAAIDRTTIRMGGRRWGDPISPSGKWEDDDRAGAIRYGISIEEYQSQVLPVIAAEALSSAKHRMKTIYNL